MLDRLRAQFPNVHSILMNREVLLLHRDFWVTEESQTGQELLHLRADERQVYDALRRHELAVPSDSNRSALHFATSTKQSREHC
jgi:hypothetical protein